MGFKYWGNLNSCSRHTNMQNFLAPTPWLEVVAHRLEAEDLLPVSVGLVLRCASELASGTRNPHVQLGHIKLGYNIIIWNHFRIPNFKKELLKLGLVMVGRWFSYWKRQQGQHRMVSILKFKETIVAVFPSKNMTQQATCNLSFSPTTIFKAFKNLYQYTNLMRLRKDQAIINCAQVRCKWDQWKRIEPSCNACLVDSIPMFIHVLATNYQIYCSNSSKA